MNRPSHLTARLGAFLVAGLVAACSFPPVHVAQLQVAPPPLMVSKKVAAPLYIVLDESAVPDDVHIPETDVKEQHIYEVRTFVSRDLKRTMELVFTTVEVVPPGFQEPSTPHYVGQVRVNGLGVKVNRTMTQSSRQGVATGGSIVGTVDWGFGLRAGGADDFVFSFSNVSVGDDPLIQVDQVPRMWEATFRVALRELVDAIKEKDLASQLLAANTAGAAP